MAELWGDDDYLYGAYRQWGGVPPLWQVLLVGLVLSMPLIGVVVFINYHLHHMEQMKQTAPAPLQSHSGGDSGGQ